MVFTPVTHENDINDMSFFGTRLRRSELVISKAPGGIRRRYSDSREMRGVDTTLRPDLGGS